MISASDDEGKTLFIECDILGRKTGTWDGAHQLAKFNYDTVAKGHPSSAIRYVGGTAGKITAYDALYPRHHHQDVTGATDPLATAARAARRLPPWSVTPPAMVTELVRSPLQRLPAGPVPPRWSCPGWCSGCPSVG